MQPQSQYITRINEDAREDEMEENMQVKFEIFLNKLSIYLAFLKYLQQVGEILGNLKQMATDMNEAVDKQNDQIGRLQEQVIKCHTTHIL